MARVQGGLVLGIASRTGLPSRNSKHQARQDLWFRPAFTITAGLERPKCLKWVKVGGCASVDSRTTGDINGRVIVRGRAERTGHQRKIYLEDHVGPGANGKTSHLGSQWLKGT